MQALSDGQGNIICVSGFFIDDPDPNVAGKYELPDWVYLILKQCIDGQDFLLGDSFFRNVYALFNYGAFIGQDHAPFVQLLSVSA